MEITAFAPPAEAHARIAYALTEVRKYLIPDSNDEIRQEQMREMEMMSANGEAVIDPLKQATAVGINGAAAMAGLRSQSLALAAGAGTPQGLSLNGAAAGPVLQGLQGVRGTNGFLTAPYVASGANLQVEGNLTAATTSANIADQ